MYTYQDLIHDSVTERGRVDAVRKAIQQHKASEMYNIAFDAEEYDCQRNVTIMKYQKTLYTLTGRAVVDLYSPNHKICSNFFNRFVTQLNQYLLGNGATFEDNTTKERLGSDFDDKLQLMGRNALVQGLAFGFWNLDHLECFKLTEFAPLWDEYTGQLMAGVRFFQIDSDKPLRATLYEIDGYTEYLQDSGEDMVEAEPKRPYRLSILSSTADGAEIVGGENYPGFPIIPMWGNAHHQSELVGLRQSIDAYDLIKSGFANDMDGAHLYWLLQNSGGIDDIDIAQMLERLNVLHAAVAEDESQITAHEVNIPYESRVAYLDRLEEDMYRDFQALNVEKVTSGTQTATAINAAYQPFDTKADAFEYQVLKFWKQLALICGVDAPITFTRNRVANRQDEINMVLACAEYLDEETIIGQICNILGLADAAEGIIARRAERDVERLAFGEPELEGKGEPETEE